jgi:hypothetical protein
MRCFFFKKKIVFLFYQNFISWWHACWSMVDTICPCIVFYRQSSVAFSLFFRVPLLFIPTNSKHSHDRSSQEDKVLINTSIRAMQLIKSCSMPIICNIYIYIHLFYFFNGISSQLYYEKSKETLS